MAHALLYKRPVEIEIYKVDFTDLVDPTDASITSSSQIKIFDSAGIDQTSYILQSSSVSGLVMTAYLANGLDGEDYTVNFNAVGNTTKAINNFILELRVRTKLAGNV